MVQVFTISPEDYNRQTQATASSKIELSARVCPFYENQRCYLSHGHIYFEKIKNVSTTNRVTTVYVVSCF